MEAFAQLNYLQYYFLDEHLPKKCLYWYGTLGALINNQASFHGYCNREEQIWLHAESVILPVLSHAG